MPKADITYSEITSMDLWCDSGHYALSEFRREGPDSLPEPTKFFQITMAGSGLIGTYCEPCLIVANYAGRCKKKMKGEI